MIFNLWRQLRLIGSVTVIAAYFVHNQAVLALGLILIAVGTINGVQSLENRITELEKELNNAKG